MNKLYLIYLAVVNMQRQLFLCIIVTLALFFCTVESCTNLLVSKGASTDDSNIIAYNADASNFYTSIYHYPAGLHENGTVRKLWSWE